jgi:hypothetical protein
MACTRRLAGLPSPQGNTIMRISRIGALSTAAAVGLGVLISATAPVANAEKINAKTIKSECSSAVKGGRRISTCDYMDNDGNGYRDYYANGEYYSTRPT